MTVHNPCLAKLREDTSRAKPRRSYASIHHRVPILQRSSQAVVIDGLAGTFLLIWIQAFRKEPKHVRVKPRENTGRAGKGSGLCDIPRN